MNSGKIVLDGTGGRTDEGSIRGPRGPKKKSLWAIIKVLQKNSILGIGNNIRNSCRETHLEDLRTCPWRRRACIRAHCLPNQDPLIPLVIISQWCLTKYDHHFPPLKLSSVFSLSDTIHKFENLMKSFFLCKEDRKLTKTLSYIHAVVYYTPCCKRIIWHHCCWVHIPEALPAPGPFQICQQKHIMGCAVYGSVDHQVIEIPFINDL